LRLNLGGTTKRIRTLSSQSRDESVFFCWGVEDAAPYPIKHSPKGFDLMAFLRFLESIRTPVGDALMSFITLFGEETLFIVLALVFFWCVDKKRGYYLLFTCFTGTICIQFLKMTFRIPRPWALRRLGQKNALVPCLGRERVVTLRGATQIQAQDAPL
jgi:hypothetical protein